MSSSPELPDELAQYLQTFLDETDEQLDDLVETMLFLEQDFTDREHLNEAFRLIHSIKGSAGMMGFENIVSLTHHLENRFELFRSGAERLDQPTTSLVLRCIDFLRQCSDRLREGRPLGSSASLLEELHALEQQPEPPASQGAVAASPEPEAVIGNAGLAEEGAAATLTVYFRPGLPLADLKAELIIARLGRLTSVRGTRPSLAEWPADRDLQQITILLEHAASPAAVRAAAEVDGVERIELDGEGTPPAAEPHAAGEQPGPVAVSHSDDPQPRDEQDEPADAGDVRPGEEPIPAPDVESAAAQQDASAPPWNDASANDGTVAEEGVATAAPRGGDAMVAVLTEGASQAPSSPSVPRSPAASPAKVAETMRVDIERLDNLMNLAGELVVNRARFIKIAEELGPAFRKAGGANRVRSLSDGLRRVIDQMQDSGDFGDELAADLRQLREGVELIDEQLRVWDQGRRCFAQITDAVDQLTRVSHSLQRGVLETRMAPVAPLFNRFKRVVRDLSSERGKRVNLVIRGEQTELDKRMIDELGDPLVHLVRNSIDHGLEPSETRRALGKPETGTITLEAVHRGNNVYILVRDDGAGVQVERVKAKIVENGLLSPEQAAALDDAEAIEYIWHPGFSTAREVSDVSGRGVGMDVVKTRLQQLNGSVETITTAGQGTSFVIRLPLTLAIINSLLVRARGVVFSMPIDDVREIVSVRPRDVIAVHSRRTFEVRGEFIPLAAIDDVFAWSRPRLAEGTRESQAAEGETTAVVILQSGGKTVGLPVDELLGSQDIVIKSLSANFVELRGLAGASILGDGGVCLMLDVASYIEMASQGAVPAAKAGFR